IRDNPQNDASGIADYGYERPLVEEFKSRFGVDPHDLPNGDERWVRLRAEPQTQFTRELRARVAKKSKPTPVAVMVGHPWQYRGTQGGDEHRGAWLTQRNSRIKAMSRLRLAFLGFRHGHVMGLYKAARQHPRVEVVAACEEDAATAQSLAGNVEITHASFDELYASADFDAVAVGDYFGRRGEIIVRALEGGKHVIA